MTRKTAVKGEANFVKGLITEATVLNFPQDACTETFNCVFEKTGAVQRRLGFTTEASLVSHATTATAAFVEYLWTGVAGSGAKSFLVQQHGRFIRFYDVSDNVVPSSNEESFTIDLNTYRPSSPTIDPATEPCAFAQGGGRLFVVNKGIDPVYVVYDAAGNTITPTIITVQERDFAGAEETGWDDKERYTGNVAALIAADSNHYYNLINQAWHSGVEDASTGFSGVNEAPLPKWDTARTDLPSNTDTPWLYLDSDDLFATSTIEKRGSGTVLAPKGHFILDVFNVNRTAKTAGYPVGYVSGTITGDRVDNKNRPETVAFYTGRVWFAGIDQEELNTSIYFSRIIEKDRHYAQCYQDNDPTTRTLIDLLPSDGGIIKIPDMDQVIKLFNFRTSLIVIATNGVWIISGSSGQSFKANDYVVKKLSTLGAHSKLSFIDFKGVPIWWGDDGIMTIKYDANYDSFNLENIVYGKIWSFYQAIPKVNRQYVKGAYDSRDDIVYWLYRDAAASTGDNYKYDSVLVMNGFSGAFYPWTLNVDTNHIRGITYISSADAVDTPLIKYTTTSDINSTTENLGYAYVGYEGYLDWGTEDYDSYFITGYAVDGEAQRYFQANYIWVYLDIDDNSSCFMQGLYDFSNANASGKWSNPQQVYSFNPLNRAVSHRRLLVRGKGKALQLKFYSESEKPFFILGWSIWETQNAGV